MANLFVAGQKHKPYAIIAAKYPSGLTCTCTKGTNMLTAKGTSGSYLFMIPEAGTWTVSCTNGTNIPSKTITISTQYQAESVILNYALYIFNNGAVSGYTFKMVSDVSGGSLVTSGNVMEMNVGQYAWYDIYSNQKLTLSNYSTMIVEVQKLSGNYGGQIGISTNNTDYEPTFYSYSDMQNNLTRQTVTVNISSVTNGYFCFFTATDVNETAKFKIYSIRFE